MRAHLRSIFAPITVVASPATILAGYIIAALAGFAPTPNADVTITPTPPWDALATVCAWRAASAPAENVITPTPTATFWFPTPTQEIAAITPTSQTQTCIVIARCMRIREAPWGRVVGGLQRGEIVSVLETFTVNDMAWRRIPAGVISAVWCEIQ